MTTVYEGNLFWNVAGFLEFNAGVKALANTNGHDLSAEAVDLDSIIGTWNLNAGYQLADIGMDARFLVGNNENMEVKGNYIENSASDYTDVDEDHIEIIDGTERLIVAGDAKYIVGKNTSNTVRFDDTINVGGRFTLLSGKNFLLDISRDDITTITGDQRVTVRGSEYLNIRNNSGDIVGNDYTISVGKDVRLFVRLDKTDTITGNNEIAIGANEHVLSGAQNIAVSGRKVEKVGQTFKVVVPQFNITGDFIIRGELNRSEIVTHFGTFTLFNTQGGSTSANNWNPIPHNGSDATEFSGLSLGANLVVAEDGVYSFDSYVIFNINASAWTASTRIVLTKDNIVVAIVPGGKASKGNSSVSFINSGDYSLTEGTIISHQYTSSIASSVGLGQYDASKPQTFSSLVVTRK